MECLEKTTIRNEELQKKIKIRLNKIEGQVRGVSKMIDDNRYCDDILIQLSAINSSIKSLANQLLTLHMHSCVIDNIKNGNDAILDEVVSLFKKFQ
ncbi:MAG: metal-sensing transcriptional repressor [Anaeroplasmataceae bacterium]